MHLDIKGYKQHDLKYHFTLSNKLSIYVGCFTLRYATMLGNKVDHVLSAVSVRSSLMNIFYYNFANICYKTFIKVTARNAWDNEIAITSLVYI